MTTQAPEPTPNNPESTNLTLEQQFTVVDYTNRLSKANKSEVLSHYKELLEHYYSQKNYYETLVKHNWGIEKPDVTDKRPTEEERRSKGD